MLPGKQGDLLQQVREKYSSKPMIVVVMSGGQVDLSYAKVNKYQVACSTQSLYKCRTRLMQYCG